MINCENCLQRVEQITLDWYQPECQLIRHLISNEDIVSIITSFLYHLYGHQVLYTRKHRSKPDYLEYDSDSEMYGYYEPKNVRLCTVCFQKGINHSLQNQQKLPYLRLDIGYFMMNLDRYTLVELQKIKKKFLKYYFPSSYYCEFYRQTKPEERDGFLYISPFKS